MPSGEQRTVVRKPFYEPKGELLRVRHGKSARWRIHLVPLPVPVALKSDPPGARITIDGRLMGQTDLTTRLMPGTYQLELERHSFSNHSTALLVEPGKEQAFEFPLAPGSSDTQLLARAVRGRWRWGLTAATAALAGLFVWQGTLARELSNEARSLDAADGGAAEHAARTEQASIFADVAGGTGLLCAGVAGYLWVTAEF